MLIHFQRITQTGNYYSKNMKSSIISVVNKINTIPFIATDVREN